MVVSKGITKMNEELHNSKELGDYLENVLDGFFKSKNEYIKCKKDCVHLRDSNNRLQIEVQEVRELEKSHRYHLSTSREIISNLQESVSNLVPLKRDIKKLNAELDARDRTRSAIEETIETNARIHKEEIHALTNSLEQKMELMSLEYDAKIKQMEQEHDTQAAQATCRAAELAARLDELQLDHKEKMNMVVLEYEERLQRANAQLAQLRDQHAGLAARTEANIDVYRRRIEDLEEKLKQSEFKYFLNSSAMVSQTPAPCEPHPPFQPDLEIVDLHSDFPRPIKPIMAQNVPQRGPARASNPLPVVQIPCNTSKQDKKTFNIVKKRKLYSDKDFQ